MRPSLPGAAAALLLLVAFAITAVLVISEQNSTTETNPELPPLQRFDLSAAFQFSYPTDWQYRIPQLNLLVAAPPDTISGAMPGPSITIERVALPLRSSLEEGLDIYLNNGPLASDDGWQASPAQALTIGERPALSSRLTRPSNETNPGMCLEIFITRAQNLFPYIITSSAPLDDCQAYDALFAAIVASISIQE